MYTAVIGQEMKGILSPLVGQPFLGYLVILFFVKIKRLRLSRGSVLAFSTQVRGFKPGRRRRSFKGEKKPQHAFLRRGSKAGGPMS